MLKIKIANNHLEMIMEGNGKELDLEICYIVYRVLKELAKESPEVALKMGINISKTCKLAADEIVNKEVPEC